MAISPDVIIFAVRAALRLGRAAALELEAHIRDGSAAMPQILRVKVEPIATVRAALDAHDLTPDQLAARETLFTAWGNSIDGSAAQAAAERAIVNLAREIGATEGAEAAEEERGLITIQQWSVEAKKEQVQPLARIGLALIEIALDYAKTNPAIFGVSSNGERFVRALASAIDEILPDSDKVEDRIRPEQLFGERAVAILMHSGLSALQEHVTDNIGEQHLRDISVSVLQPLVDNFKDGTIARKSLVELRELVLGPMTQQAIKAVARHQGEFLGDRFGDNRALGAVTNAVLVTIANTKDANGDAVWQITDALDRGVWLEVYDSILDVAITRPDLFAGETDARESAFGRELVVTVATRLKDMTPPLSKSLAATVTADAIGVFSRHTVILFDEAGPWDQVARNALSQALSSVSAGMKAGLAADGALSAEAVLNQVFSEAQVGTLVGIVLDQVAATPGMITGDGGRDEVKALVAGIARTVSDTNRNLLSGEDWLEVAAIVAEQAAKNPGRLFAITDAGGPVRVEDELAVRVIRDLLGAAAEDFRDRGRGRGSVLFGETLKEVITETIERTAENAEAALGNESALIDLVKAINALQGESPTAFGREQWLRIYREAAKQVLLGEDGDAALAALTENDSEALRKLASVDATE